MYSILAQNWATFLDIGCNENLTFVFGGLLTASFA